MSRRAAVVALVAALGAAGAGTFLPAAAAAAGPRAVLGAPVPTQPVFDRDAPDPSVIAVTSTGTTTYYAYTTASAGDNIQVLSSLDLQHWVSDGDALPSLPSWQAKGRTWAPGVVFLGGRYVMWYATEVAATGDECLSEATATSPTGPFSDPHGAPVVCQSALGGSIDPYPMVDRNGVPYLYWKSNAGMSPLSAQIWASQLTPDGTALTGQQSAVLGQDQAWEATVESPAMVDQGGAYVLFYSGGVWNGAGYGVGYALCSGPLGPCGKPTDGPILHSDQYRLGPGGESLFTDPSGNLWMAYAAWDGPTSRFSYGAGEFRSMWIAAVTLSGATPTIHAGEAPEGYRMAAADGGIFTFGADAYHGSMGGHPLAQPVTGVADDAATGGYWEVAADGGVFAFGASYRGSMGGQRLASPIVSMAATPDGGGYWLVGTDGGIFAFGDAAFHGSMGGQRLGAPIVGMAPTRDGGGYWLVGADGGIFAFGDATYQGSMGGHALDSPVAAMAATPSGNGYWLVGADGGIFAFGDAAFFGSMGGQHIAAPVVAIVGGPGGGGYWLVGADGGVFAFGDGDYLGAMGGVTLEAPVVTAG
ncbi:MAG: glycoside hydrolase family 43 protein [Acidimicrobiales bacterium]